MHDQSNPHPRPSGKRTGGAANGRALAGPPSGAGGGGPVPNYGGGQGAKPSLKERVTQVEALIPHLATKADVERLGKELRKEFRRDLKDTNDRIDRKTDRLSAEIRWGIGLLAALMIAVTQLQHLL